MTAKYKLVRNPNPDPSRDSQSLPLHPRLISCGTISSKELFEVAKERSSFSPADMKGVLQLLKDVISDYLMAGYHVELDGIGTFSVSLEGNAPILNNKIRSESIRFKSVNFRASNELKDRLKTMVVSKELEKENDRSSFSAEECKLQALSYLETSPFLTQNEYMRICKCSRSKASIDLGNFVKEGWLSRKRIGTMYLYYKEKENVDKPDFSEIIH